MAKTIKVIVAGDEKGLSRSLKSASKQVGIFGRLAKRGISPIRSHTKALLGMAAGFASIAAAKDAVHTTVGLAKATIGLHKNLGLTVEDASAWAAQAQARGIETKQLAQGFGLLSKQVYAATHNSKPAIKAFNEIGLRAKDLAKLKFEDVIERVADGIQKLPPGMKRTALNMKLFGRGWQTLTPLLRDGSKGIREQLDLAKKYGATFHGKTLKSVQDFIAAERESKLATMGLKIAFATAIIPVLIRMIGWFDRFVAFLRSHGKEIHAFWNKIGQGAKWLYNNVLKPGAQAVVGWIKAHWPEIKNVAQQVWNHVKTIAVSAFSGIKTAAQTMWPIVKTAFKIAAAAVPVLVTAIRGVITAVKWVVNNIPLLGPVFVAAGIAMAAGLGPVGAALAAIVASILWIKANPVSGPGSMGQVSPAITRGASRSGAHGFRGADRGSGGGGRRASSFMPAGGPTMVVPVYLDGKEITRSVSRHARANNRRRGVKFLPA